MAATGRTGNRALSLDRCLNRTFPSWTIRGRAVRRSRPFADGVQVGVAVRGYLGSFVVALIPLGA